MQLRILQKFLGRNKKIKNNDGFPVQILLRVNCFKQSDIKIDTLANKAASTK